jgi:predicted nuclease of restriction endonuclease-like (RecB) superfamily
MYMAKDLVPSVNDFGTVISIIENAKGRALKAVNAELINMYWEVGEYLSKLCAESTYGDKVIDEVANYISATAPTIKGFNRRGLYRMRQFYETYKDDEIVSALLTQLSWTNHLLIMSKSKTKEERDFYVALAAKEHYSSRELERQLDSAYYERYMLSSGKQPPELVPQKVRNTILDTYVLEFLDLPEQYSERNFRKAIIQNLKQFILEFGKDFTFVGNQYHLEKFGKDHFVDLLFYNRELMCLVAVELKLGEFKPIYLGQLQTYLQILDDEVRKPNENPSIGIVLCQDMDKSYVEYVIQRYDSPMGVAKYHTSVDMPEELRKALPDIDSLKRLLSESNDV